MREILQAYKTHKLIDTATIGGGICAIIVTHSLGNSDDMVGVAFCVFFNFYLVRSFLALIHYCFSRKLCQMIKASSETLDKKILEYPSFITTRSVFRIINLSLLLVIVFVPSRSIFDGLFYANFVVVPLCILERLYLEKIAQFDVSGEYLIKMNDARFSGGHFSSTSDRSAGTRSDSHDPGNPRSTSYSTSYYSSRNTFH